MHILAIIFGFMLVIYLVLLLGKIQMQLWEGKEPENTLNIFSIYLKVAGGGNSNSRVHEMDLPTLIQTMKASIAAKKEAKSGKVATDSKPKNAADSANVQVTQATATATEQPAPEQKSEEPKVAASEPEVAAAETQATKPVAAEELKAVAAELQEPKNPEVVTSEQEPAAVETQATKSVATETEVAATEPEQQTVTTEVKKTADSQAVSEQNETAEQPKNKEAESEKTI